MMHLLTFSASAATALIAAIWQGSLLALCVALCLRLLPGMSAAIRSAIWLAVFAIVFALHFVPAFSAASVPGGIQSAQPAHPLQLAASWSLVLACIWILLSLFRAAQFAVSAWRLRTVLRRAIPIDLPLNAPLISRRYLVCVSPDVDRPSVLGFFSPRVLLPPGLAETLSSEDLHQVLLHETEHLNRADDWTNLLQKLALVLFPLNPVLLWVERRLCLERELACDDRVLHASSARKAYAACLTHLAEHTILRRGLSLALGALGVSRPRQSDLARRVHRILAQPQRLMGRTASRVATASLLLAVGSAAGVLTRAPRLVSFVPSAPHHNQRQTAELSQPIQYPASEPAARPMMVNANTPLAQPTELRVAAGHIPAQPHRRSAVAHLYKPAAPRIMAAASSTEALQPQMRLTLTFASGDQVQHLYVPAVAHIPAAYAAVATPDGWIIIQL